MKKTTFLTLLFVCLACPAMSQEQASTAPTQGLKPQTYSSTMFYSEELERINIVIEALRNNQELPQKKVEQVKPVANTVYTYPQFHLSSIAYYGSENWVIWVNGKKMTSEQSEVIPGLTIDSVTKDQVSMTYNYLGDAMIHTPSEIEDTRISADEFNQTATAKLDPNQTFSLYSWRVYEGVVRPVTKMVRSEEDLADALPTVDLDRMLKETDN